VRFVVLVFGEEAVVRRVRRRSLVVWASERVGRFGDAGEDVSGGYVLLVG